MQQILDDPSACGVLRELRCSETLKREFARQHQLDREAYTEAKRPFIDRVTAMLWT